ncbi:MAG: single-stranded DNA-binding protein [Peptostreptococcaceae bacterium]
MANSIQLIGRITKDLESKIAGKTTVCNFTIAVNRKFAKEGQQKTDFINCVCFGKVAENLCKYQGKGSLIGVNGSLNIDQYQKDGENKSFTKVVANEIEFLSGAGDKKADTDSNGSFEIVDEDIPF